MIVLFGATGDLAKRKLLPGLAYLDAVRARPGHPDRRHGDGRHEHRRVPRARPARPSTSFGTHTLDDAAWQRFAERLTYVPQGAGPEGSDVGGEGGRVAARARAARRLHYLSVPPKAAEAVIAMLRDADLAENSRVVMEKPFGHDLASAVQLNDFVHSVFDESQIFRIDHFLGKEAAQNILAFRFANGLFEPIWNRNFIDHVQIDIPETLGLDQRANFYEATGAYKDMVVTHLMQVMAFVAMEPPTALEPRAISEEKNKVFRSMLPIDPRKVVRGQYGGYRDEPGVNRDSDTETFIALQVDIDNWRWAGVPFYLRTGKTDGRGPADHLDRVQGGAADDVPGELRRRQRRGRTT